MMVPVGRRVRRSSPARRDDASGGGLRSPGRPPAPPSIFLLLLPLLLSLAACGEWLFGPGNERAVPVITELPRALSSAEVAVIQGSARFGLELLRAVAEEEGAGENVVLSPLSASMALGMTLEGAESETFAQMRDALGFDGRGRKEVSAAYRDLLDLLYDLDPTVEFRIGNSVWHRDTMAPESEFVDAVQAYFDAVVEGLDFSSKGAARRINEWVSQATKGRIDEIVEDAIDPMTVMFLINAAYFNGTWTWEFDPYETAQSDFTLRNGSRVEVPMMMREPRPTRFASGARFTAVELPYGGQAFTMTLVLPPVDQNLHDFVASLDAALWDEITGELAEGAEAEAAVHLPRFQLEYEKILGQAGSPENRALQSLGMEDAFLPDRADFSRMHRNAREMGLHVHQVKQKTWIDVHERGTEAAAVTSVEMRVVSARPIIRIDRPFFFALRERLSGTLLFVGLVEDPRGM